MDRLLEQKKKLANKTLSTNAYIIGGFFKVRKFMREAISIKNADYPTIYSWCNRTISLADKVYEEYLNVFIRALYSILEEHAPNELVQLNSLCPKSKQLIIEAPETYERLNSVLREKKKPDWLISFLNTSIAVELFRAGDMDNRKIKKWSANGDFFADETDSENINSISGWRISGKYFSKKIGTVPIDHSSIFTRANMPVAPFRSVQYGFPSPLSEKEKDIAEIKIIKAFQAIENASPNAARFILKYVKSIVLRKNSDDPYVFQSASRNAYIGQIVLLNSHCSHVDYSYIAESLIHEAIHSLMWRQEILSHFLIDPSKPMGTVISPWSGEKLYYYTLLQAVFVWYGIACFWKQAMNSRMFPSQRAESLFNRAIRGFHNDNLFKSLASCEKNLNEGVLSVFSHMIETARKLEGVSVL